MSPSFALRHCNYSADSLHECARGISREGEAASQLSLLILPDEPITPRNQLPH